jgi:N-acetylmuramoyl-L-alanine amidase
MRNETKNGKHHTNSINIAFLTIIVLISFNLKGFADGHGKKENFIIVIDPGHGGKDPGAVGSFSYEKDIVLSVAIKLGEYLQRSNNSIKVIYTRNTDIYVSLRDRAEIANKNNADLFISIHANLIIGKNAYGTETFIMGHSLDEENLQVAMKENEVILLESDYSTKYEGFDPKTPESYIMFSLTQNAYAKQSTELASMIQTQFKEKIGRFDRGVKQERFLVLWRTAMPSVLTEIGFISNHNEEKYMNSKQGQDDLASSIFKACKEYIDEINKKTIDPAKIKETTLVSDDSIKTNALYKGKTVFMIQVVTSAKKIEIKPENFKNINDIVQLFSGNKYRYATGVFTDYEKAVAYRKQIAGIYRDAFVIAVKDNKILPLREALDKESKRK